MAYTNSSASRYNGKVDMKIILDNDIADALEAESQKTRISKSALVRMILAQWMEQKKQDEQKYPYPRPESYKGRKRGNIMTNLLSTFLPMPLSSVCMPGGTTCPWMSLSSRRRLNLLTFALCRGRSMRSSTTVWGRTCAICLRLFRSVVRSFHLA